MTGPVHHVPSLMRLDTSGISRTLAVLLATSLVLGVLFRNVWVEDMEWKHDEQTMFQSTQSDDPWPWVGMRSSVGLPNPGMSVWVFSALARLFRAHDPLALGRSVMVTNSVALLLLLFFALSRPIDEERTAWLWAFALGAVNPGAVQLERKIWTLSVFPVFSLIAIYGWFNRRTRWGAFLWGLLGACLGQIHMSGFFFAAALALWTLLFDRTPATPRPRWRWWLLGSALAAWPLMPWAASVLTLPRGAVTSFRLHVALRFEFWLQWLRDVAGLQTERSLGRQPYLAWLGEPLWNGHPTGLVGALFFVSTVLIIAALVGATLLLWRRRRDWRALLAGESATGTLQNAAFLGFGLLLTAAGVPIYSHYLFVIFPLTCLWLARAALLRPVGPSLLAGIWLSQLLLAGAFLLNIHQRGGSPGGDYGVAYGWQAR